MAVAMTSSPKISPQAENGLLEVTIRRGAFVAAADEHEHEVGGVGVERDVADLVDDSSGIRCSRSSSCRGGRGVGRRRAARPIRWRCGRGRGGRPGRRGSRARSPGGSCRCRAGRAGRCSRGRRRKSSWPRCSTSVALDRALEGEVELLERLAGGEAGGLDPCLAAVAVAAVDLGLQQHGGELLIAPLLCAGAVGELGQRPGRRRRLERPEQVRELGASGGSCDQRVIDGQRADLDRGLPPRRSSR